ARKPKNTSSQLARKPKAQAAQSISATSQTASIQRKTVESESIGIDISDLSLDELEKLSLDDLKKLEKTLPEAGGTGKVDLKKVLGKLDLSKIDLTRVRKKGTLSDKAVNSAMEVVTKNAALFDSKKSGVKRKIPQLGVLQYRTYLTKVDPILRKKWKIPLELTKDLEVRVKVVVSRDGTVLQYGFLKISNNKIFDQSVRDLMNEIEKLPPLPEGFKGPMTEIGLKFTPK
ncbi:MAG: TonB C-terminal domain-containing protein, partial [Candidatus Marinimicrobia bacterium]|nr:TonB C-terminal domain-containing protein [Candidatus Neomarinimicrobiota bacterium]